MWIKCITVHVLAYGSLMMSIGDWWLVNLYVVLWPKQRKIETYHCYYYYSPMYNYNIDYYSPMCNNIYYYSSICNNIDYYNLVSNNSQMCNMTFIITDWYVITLNITVKCVITLIIIDRYVITLIITVQCVIALTVSLFNFTSMCLDSEVYFFFFRSCERYGRFVGRFEN